MDQHPDPRRLDGGFASIQFVIAAALAMLMVVGLIQLVAYQYTRGVVLAALERGARAGSVAGAGVAECGSMLAVSLTDTLGDSIVEASEFSCDETPDRVIATAKGVVPGWLTSATDLTFDLEAWAWRETE